VTIPHDLGLVGHSDADVLLHAVTDALLGAAALGDIGELFPDTDPANKDRDSADMLRLALAKVAEAGFRVVNVDSIVFAERPKLSAYKTAIRERMAELLGISVDRVGFKAKTGERVGPVGRQEAMMAEAVVLIESMRGEG
jgi:2-C-methyl-D-erythritol 2,4-cyclodiphosphate synthase